jgi:hypothetical protein
MAEATIQEKQNIAELNQTRSEESQDEQTAEAKPSSQINFVEMGLILGAALTIDALALLSLTGVLAILVLFIQIPATLSLWLWRVLKHQAGPKKDLTFQLIIAFLGEIVTGGFLPTNSIFVLYCYFKDTKLGKETVGRAKKLTEPKKPNE